MVVTTDLAPVLPPEPGLDPDKSYEILAAPAEEKSVGEASYSGLLLTLHSPSA